MNIESMSMKLARPAAPGAVAGPSLLVTPAFVPVAEAPAAREGRMAPTPKQLVAVLNHVLQDDRRDLRFRVDESSGRTIVEVVAAGSGDVIRQIPGDEILRMASMLAEGAPLDSLGLEAWS